MWAPAGSEDVGYLIDLDFAASVEPGSVEETTTDDALHTLALPFLAIDHLPPDALVMADSSPPQSTHHIYRHDLESFFWSVWWILLNAVRYRDGPSNIDKVLLGWQSYNLGQNRAEKEGFLLLRRQWSSFISQKLWPQHEHRAKMEAFLKDISQMFNEGHRALEKGSDYPTAGGHVTFENFMQVFMLE